MSATLLRNPLHLTATERGRCPACGGADLFPVMTLPQVPANSCLMLDTPEEARAFPRGDIALVLCEACGLVHNRAFDPGLTEYSERYEPTQAWSPTFQRFHRALAARLAGACDLRGGTAVEVGCGQGEFLHLLCAEAGCRGIGFDPCLDAERGDVVRERAAGVRLIGEFFAEETTRGLTADLLLCKMTLEHIPAAGRFLAAAAEVARASRPGMRLFLQVPESERIFRDCAFEDVYYEHCNYFTEVSLRALVARHGFAVEEVTREYAGQYLAILARYQGVAPPPAGGLAALRRMVEGFAAECGPRMAEWRQAMARRAAAGGRVVVWGSGSKGVTFLGALGGGAEVSHVVDINPHRQGHFMVGTGHPIVGPAALGEIRPTTVVVMNRVYREEVAGLLVEQGLAPEILAL